MAIIELPTKPVLRGAKFNQLKWMVYGASGIGKSTFFSKMADGDRLPIFLATDPGHSFMKVISMPIYSWKNFSDAVDTLVAKPSPVYSIVVLDTVDILFRMCRKYVCEREGINHVSELEWGKGTDMVRDLFELQIAKLALLDRHGIGLGFISHSKDVEVRGRAIRTSKVMPTLQNAAYGIVAPLCDVIGMAGFKVTKADAANPDGLERIIQFAPDETVDAKDRTGLLPAACKLDFDVIRGYLEEGGVESGGETVESGDEEVEESSPRGSAKKAEPAAARKKKRRA